MNTFVRLARGLRGIGPPNHDARSFALVWFGVPLLGVVIASWLDLPTRAAEWLYRYFG